MNKNTIIGIVIAVIVLGGGFALMNNQSSKSSEDAAMVKDDAMMKKDPTERSDSKNQALDNNSKYIEYSKEAFDNAKGARRVLFFYASWCPICIPADADFRANVNKFPEDLVLIRVNYNDPDTDQEEKDLAKKYIVTYQHTFVQIDSQGKEVKKWNGGVTTEELLGNLQ